MTSVVAIPGAALYIVRGKEVFMREEHGQFIWIGAYRNEKAAQAKRDRFQTEENSAVSRGAA